MITEDAACIGKVRYLTKADARRVRKQMGGRGHISGNRKLNAYVCAFCGFYHLGHMPQSVRNGQITKEQWRQ